MPDLSCVNTYEATPFAVVARVLSASLHDSARP
jgi:hypothetical protein